MVTIGLLLLTAVVGTAISYAILKPLGIWDKIYAEYEDGEFETIYEEN